jgi:hypothetical protein
LEFNSRVCLLQSLTKSLSISIHCSCFLATFFFTQQLLPAYIALRENLWADEEPQPEKEAIEFVKNYGAYLQLHTCLSCSAAVKAETMIEELLSVASHDVSHRDATREIHKAASLTFYDSVSAWPSRTVS